MAKHHQREHLTEADLRQALEDFIPAYSPEMQLFMGLLALREANSRRMIPEALLPVYQEFVEGNRIDKTGINRRFDGTERSVGSKRLIYSVLNTRYFLLTDIFAVCYTTVSLPIRGNSKNEIGYLFINGTAFNINAVRYVYWSSRISGRLGAIPPL